MRRPEQAPPSRWPASAAGACLPLSAIIARTHDAVAIIRSLTDAGITRGHADAIVSAMRSMADRDDHPTKEHFDTTIDNLREHTAAADSAAEARICRAMLIQTLAILGGLLAILRLLG